MSGSTLPTTTCPAPMTRASLIALRNAGGLSKDCDYVITDHVQGRLVAGTTIHLQAVDASTLSENVSVKTTYDNIAWLGIYDIDMGGVTYLQDNLNNTARGVTPVTNFDWGNPAFQHCSILGGVVTYTYGNTASIQYLHVEGATLDLTGYAGNIRKLRITDESTVNLTGARIRFLNCVFSGNSTVNLSGVTDTGTLQKWHLNGSLINFSNSNTIISTLLSVRAQNSSWNCTNVTTGSFVGSGFDISNSTLTFLDGIGIFAVQLNSNLQSGAVINFSAGNLTITRSVISSGAILRIAGAGSVVLSDAIVSTGAQIQTIVGGSSNLSITNTRVSGGTLIDITAAAIGGALTMTGCLLDTASTVTLSNTRSYNLTGTTALDANLNLTGTNNIVDIIRQCYFAQNATLTLGCDGAANTIQRCTAVGNGTSIQILGTSGGAVYNNVNVLSDSSVVQNNLGNALTLTECFVSAGSSINLQNCAAGQNMQYIYVERQGSLTVNKTTNNVIQAVRVDNASFTINATTGNIINATVNGGSLVINDGVISGMTKMMAGTLTINTGTQSNIWYQSPVNKTITASNTNRAEYLGLVSAVPLV